MGDITAITLMGTDVERIIHGAQMFHEVWGSLLNIIIASWLLGRQVSLACLAPVLLVLGQSCYAPVLWCLLLNFISSIHCCHHQDFLVEQDCATQVD